MDDFNRYLRFYLIKFNVGGLLITSITHTIRKGGLTMSADVLLLQSLPTEEDKIFTGASTASVNCKGSSSASLFAC